MTIHTDPKRRHDFVLLFDVTNGNPNGDPDGGNMPRTDAETSHGIVTDVAIKRKIRNYVATYEEYEATDEQSPRLKIFVEHHGVLNEKIRSAYVALKIPTGKSSKAPVDEALLDNLREIVPLLPAAFVFTDVDSVEGEDVGAILEYSGELSDSELKNDLEPINETLKLNKTLNRFIYDLVKKAGKPDKNRENADRAKVWMCQNFYDIRMFGAVLSTGLNAGQVRGPMQITFAQSVDPVLPQDLAITRVAVTAEKDREKLQTIGRKTYIPYGLYVAHGFYSPYLAEQTSVDQFDLELFWEALVKMWDMDRSASRGMIAPRGLYVFTHDKKLGDAPAHKLFERIQPKLKEKDTIPRQFSDYEVLVNDVDLPTGITLTPLIEG